MSKHTPGPWRYEPVTRMVNGDGEYICEMSGARSIHQAGARLIAAAPEMYEALKQARTAMRVEHSLHPDYGWGEFAEELITPLLAKIDGA